MTREIKFRALCSKINKWDTYTLEEMFNRDTGYISFGDNFDDYQNWSQFTGLKDKNGEEIYEGDIIQVLDRDWSDYEKDTQKLVVYYSRDSYVLISPQGIEEIEKDNPNTYNPLWVERSLYRVYGRDRFEIIGNIYENPELIK